MFLVALPPAEPPARVVAGVQVTWPLSKSETVLSPGAKLTVKIVSTRRSAVVSFVRVNAAGKGIKTVAKRTLRRGSFTVTVPAATGARYALRFNVAGRKRFSWVTTPVPVSPPPASASAPAPAATPAPTPTPLPFCGPEIPQQQETDINATVSLAAGPVQAGQTLAYTVTNSGPGIFLATSWFRLVADGDASPRVTDTAPPNTRLLVGEAAQRNALIPEDTAPGLYRLSAGLSYTSCDMTGLTKVALSEPFEVTAP